MMDDTYISMYICQLGIVWRGVMFSSLANKVTQSCEKKNQDKESHGHLLRWLHRGVVAPNVMVSVIRTE